MPSVELQTYLASLPPHQREAISKLPETQQISIMNENLKNSSPAKVPEQIFDFEKNTEIGLIVEKNNSAEKPAVEEKPVVENNELSKEAPKTTAYIIQNNTGLYYYANLQGETRKKTDSSYEEVDLKRELGVLKKNNPEKVLKNLIVGQTIILEGEVDTSKMKNAQESVQKYTNGQKYLEKLKAEAERKEIEKQKEIERQKHLTGTALKQNVVQMMSKNYKAASESFNNQLSKDGWAADVADGVSVLWNNRFWNATGNRAKFVRADLEQYRKDTLALNKALNEGSYEKKFKEIFGVDYSEANIQNYNAKEQKLKEVSVAVSLNDVLDKTFESSLKKNTENYGFYKDHVETLNSPTGTFNRKTPKEYLLNEVESNLIRLIGKDTLNTLALNSGIDLNKTPDKEKYFFYISLVKNMQNSAKETLKTTLNGRKPEDYLKDFEIASKKAFGSQNNIQERVTKYNNSQETGAAVVKGVTQIALVAGSTALVVASGGTATPFVVGGLTAASSISVEVTDRATNKTKGDLKGKDLGKIVIDGAIDGALSFTGPYMKKGIVNLKTFEGKALQKTWTVASNVIAGTVEGTVSDYLKGGYENISKETILARTIISSTLGNVNMLTNNQSVLNGVKYTKAGATKATLQDIKLEIKKQAKNNPQSQEVLKWIEANPQEFEKIVESELKNK